MRQQPDGTYVNTDRPILFGIGALLFASSLANGAWYRYQHQGLDVGTIAMCAGCVVALVFALSLRTTRFVFDPGRKLITWSSRSFLASDGGQLAFSDVRSVDLQTSEGQSGGVLYRVALKTDDKTLPLGVEYSNGEKRVQRLADTIRALVAGQGETAPLT